ncbi:tyrosine-type recombinase/integrase [Pseudomonas fluorescens]|uniref:tyrosine-type recombinase/integrase n=1 Tax=Pseudomonas fluorescens TaxID=294 RepID=UPI000AE30649|nr:tyrosine-type recombinase/integrase [Pseudomonas fluorescens]
MRDKRRCCETLAFPQTPQGIQAAAGLRAQVVQLAKLGMLSDEKYAELFPSSSYTTTNLCPLFGEYAQAWIDSREIVRGTRCNYLSMFNLYWMPALAREPLDRITSMTLRKIISATPWKTTSIKRSAISVLGSLFKTAVTDELIERSPTASIEKPAKNKKVVDPFSAQEADAIIEWMYANFTNPRLQMYAPYFEFAFYTGMRTGEIAGLRWDEVDRNKRIAHICRIVVDGKIEERTKTRNTRAVMLNSRALHALEKMEELTARRVARAVKGHRPVRPSDHVFSPTGVAGFIAKPNTTNFQFAKATRALGMRTRRQYNCRHTYATMCLMAGMNPAFIARQLGHSVQMLLTTYTKWLDSTTDWTELDKLENVMIGTKVVQENPQLA